MGTGEPIYFDSNAFYGVRWGQHPEERWSLEHLLDDMSLAGIAGALVHHVQAFESGYMYGNLRLVDEIADQRKMLFPCWVVMPHQAGDFPEPARLMQLMDEHDVHAVALFPHGAPEVPVDAPTFGPLAKALADRDILVKASYPSLGWQNTDRLLSIFSGCPVLVADASWRNWRSVVSLMSAHPNMHLEFSTFQANRAIEWFGERFGWERLLFGTGQTPKSPGAARAMIDLAAMDSAHREMVAGRNLAQLLRVEMPPPPAPSGWEDEFTANLRAGQPCPFPCLDAHAHVLHDGANGGGRNYVMIRGDARGEMELYDRIGVGGVAWMSWNGTVAMDAPAGNLITARAVEQFPERAIGLVSINPACQTQEEIQDTISTYHGQLGFRGCKPYIRSPLVYNDESYERWWNYADRHELWGLFHVDGGMEVVEDVAERHPNFQLLIAHTGSSYEFAKKVVASMHKFDNIYAELTFTTVTNGIVEWLCRQVGPQRVVFGTDSPMRDPRPQFGWVVFTRLPAEQKRLVLGDNLRRILARGKLPSPPLPPVFRMPPESAIHPVS